MGWRTYQAYTHLQNASVEVQQLQDQLTDITESDPAATATTIAGLQTETAAALEAVDDPLYRRGDRRAVRRPEPGCDPAGHRQCRFAGHQGHAVAGGRRPEPAAGRFGAEERPDRSGADRGDLAAAAGRRRRGQRGAWPNWPPSISPRWRVRSPTQCRPSRPSSTMPLTSPGPGRGRPGCCRPCSGRRAPATYLVVFQNPAEARATGGIFGSYAILTADQGKITIDNQASASRTLDDLDGAAPGAQLRTRRSCTATLIAQRPQDVNFTPDFPTAAQRFIADVPAQEPRSGGRRAGDRPGRPVLHAQGLARHPGRQRHGDHLGQPGARRCSSDAYTEFGSSSSAQDARDQFLDDATGKVFSEVMSGNG